MRANAVYGQSLLTLLSATGLAFALLAVPAPPPLIAPALAQYCHRCLDEQKFSLQLRHVMHLFDNLFLMDYRRSMFRLIGETRRLGPQEILQRLKVVLAEAKATGADGIEPLILTYADAIGETGRAWWIRDANALLAGTTIKYRHARPYEAMLQPLGRAHTRMILSVRPSITRAAVAALLANPSTLTMERLFALASLQENICALPRIRGDTDLLRYLSSLDKQREVSCDQGAIGGGAGRGRMRQTLQAVGVDACLDLSLESLRDDTADYTTAEKMADLKQCMKDMTDARHPANTNPFADDGALIEVGLPIELKVDLGPPLQEAIKQVGETSRTGMTEANAHAKLVVAAMIDEWKQEKQREREMSDALIQANVDAAGALVDLANAQGEADRAEKELNEAKAAEASENQDVKDAIRDACVQCSDEENRRHDEEVAQEKREAADAKARREQAEQAAKEARAKRDAAMKKAAEALAKVAMLKKAQDTFDPNPLASAACNRLIANGVDFMDPVDMRRLPQNWTDFKSRFDRVSNPDPNAPVQGSDAFALPSCGKDPSTNRGASNCASLTTCAPGDEQCTCNRDAEHAEAEARRAEARAAPYACAAAQCPSGTTPTPKGQFCSCENQPDTGEGRPPPIPVGEIFLDTTASPAASIYQAQGPLSGVASEILRDRTGAADAPPR